MNEAFEKQIEGMTDAYLQWFSSLGDAGLANNDPAPSSREFQDKYIVTVLDTFGTFFLFSKYIYIYISNLSPI